MRILHTADWHLGQSFHQFDRSWEHARFLAWLLDTLEAEAIDALLIAGDVFDNSNPSAAAQAQLYRFLTEARQRVPHLSVVMIAGNHDSPGRIEAPSPFLSLFDATAIGALNRRDTDGEPDIARTLVPLKNREGDIAAWCVAMPFLRQADVPAADTPDDDRYLAGIRAAYARAFAEALARRAPGQAIVAMGHCHLAGGTVSEESERRIVIGGAEALPADTFHPAAAYVALGHLHRAQRIGNDDSRRYSGSPLPLSFSEVIYPHQVVRVDLDGESVTAVSPLCVPRAVDLLRVPAQPAPLDAVLDALAALELPDQPPEAWPYLQVRVRLAQPEPALRTRIEAALAGRPVRLARIEVSAMADPTTAAAPPVSIDDLHSLSPVQFFERLYQHRFNAAPPDELLEAFNELANAVPETEVTR